MTETALSFLVKLENVTKTYFGASHEFRALKGIDFSLSRGEFVGIIGASGSGKSTLMNIIGLLDRCTTGEYFFSDQAVSGLSDNALAHIRNRKIGFVFQSFFLLPRLTAIQNVMLPLFYRGETGRIAEEKAISMLSKVGMREFALHKPNALSGGQQQRVAIARALIGDPELILADEPTGSLDHETSSDVMHLLLQLNRDEQRTILLITHDREVSQQCQRVVMIKDGRML